MADRGGEGPVQARFPVETALWLVALQRRAPVPLRA